MRNKGEKGNIFIAGHYDNNFAYNEDIYCSR